MDAKPTEPVMSIEETRSVLEADWQEHDPRYVAEDAVFIGQPTDEEIRGGEAIGQITSVPV
jgi:hypothetical protein